MIRRSILFYGSIFRNVKDRQYWKVLLYKQNKILT